MTTPTPSQMAVVRVLDLPFELRLTLAETDASTFGLLLKLDHDLYTYMTSHPTLYAILINRYTVNWLVRRYLSNINIADYLCSILIHPHYLIMLDSIMEELLVHADYERARLVIVDSAVLCGIDYTPRLLTMISERMPDNSQAMAFGIQQFYEDTEAYEATCRIRWNPQWSTPESWWGDLWETLDRESDSHVIDNQTRILSRPLYAGPGDHHYDVWSYIGKVCQDIYQPSSPREN